MILAPYRDWLLSVTGTDFSFCHSSHTHKALLASYVALTLGFYFPGGTTEWLEQGACCLHVSRGFASVKCSLL